MKKNLYQVIDFHKKFDLPGPDTPQMLDLNTFMFRAKFMQEELNEFKEAHAEGDLEKSFDSLIDLIYVALGTAYLQGFTPEVFEEGWDRVHEANMAKERCTDASKSSRGSTADVIKPEGWKAPDHRDLLGLE